MRYRAQGELARAPDVLRAVTRAARAGTSVGERAVLSGRDTYLKGSALRGRVRLRHALRRLVLRAPLPRVREFENLAWLRDHGFGAPKPLAAGALRLEDAAPFQFLVTEWVRDATRLDATLDAASPERRRELLALLGREVGRLHAAGFVHRDLYPRNLLVRNGADELVFLDAWRGGARVQLRGESYDHAALMLEGATRFTPEEQALYFRRWALARGCPRGGWERRLARIARERRALVRRLERRGRTDLVREWDRRAVLAALGATG